MDNDTATTTSTDQFRSMPLVSRHSDDLIDTLMSSSQCVKQVLVQSHEFLSTRAFSDSGKRGCAADRHSYLK